MKRLPLLLASAVATAALLVVPGSYAAKPAVTPAVAPAARDAQPPSHPVQLRSRTLRVYPAFDADQGVAVDGRSFYSVDNYSITRHDRRTGAPERQWYGGEDGPVVHLDGASIIGDRLYAPHSNYPAYPETSSVEVWDPRTMRHLSSHTFGVDRGSLTWIDRHDGSWWATFANYDKVQDGQTRPYGETANTQMVRMNDRFEVEQAWIFPDDLLAKFRPMSNSGGSWGPDGRLYITGHDAAEVYVLELPGAGSVVRWVATISAPRIAGQGIAWDRSDPRHPTLWAITADSKHVVQMSVPLQPGRPRTPRVGHEHGPGNFQRPTS